MTHADIVLDASVAMRGLAEDGPASALMASVAQGTTAAQSPDLIVPEITNALRVGIGAGRWPAADALVFLETLLAYPLTLQPSAPLAEAALETALSQRISAYDAFYLVLAESLELPLVTADRRLAAATRGSLLVE